MDFFQEIRQWIGVTRPGQKHYPPHWSGEQTRVFERLHDVASEKGIPLGISRRDFLKSQIGLIAFFTCMNQVFGSFFNAAASEPMEGGLQTKNRADQFVFDVQVHFVRSGYPNTKMILGIREGAKDWNPRLKGKEQSPEDIQFENFYRELFDESETKMAVLSNAPADRKEEWFLSNSQAMQARQKVNQRAGRPRLLAHWVITPGHPDWIEELERGFDAKPDAWKGYTVGDPFNKSRYSWRLDDERLVYPAYERMVKAGIRTVCIHKGLLPPGYEKRFSREQIANSGVNDLGRAARDWPDLNFIVYHAAMQKFLPDPQDAAQFRKTGRIPWVTDLAEIPAKYGVTNVYGEIGGTFATTAGSNPELCAGMLGTLVRGLGPDHVCWGTDSVFFGSPQWQIEAMRRIEIPEAMQKQYGFQPLGAKDSRVKRMIFGLNAAQLYGIRPHSDQRG